VLDRVPQEEPAVEHRNPPPGARPAFEGDPLTEKRKRLEDAAFERAEAAVRWEDADNTAAATGRASDQVEAAKDDLALSAADLKIKRIRAEP
jgi:hypothetical protein